MGKVRVHRRHGAPKITKHGGSHFYGESRLPEFLVKTETMVTIVRFRQARVFVGSTPITIAGFNDHSPQTGGMTVCVLGGGMNDDICPVFHGAGQGGGGGAEIRGWQSESVDAISRGIHFGGSVVQTTSGCGGGLA